ncbi:MAG TPA: peptidase T [Anaerolineaceae bacterium]
MSSVVERFIRYVQIDTQSSEDSDTFPSTAKQLDLARLLARELEALGLQGASVDANGYVMGFLPSNLDRHVPAVGFIAHMDTSPEASGTGVHPQVIQRYDGGDIVLNPAEQVVLSPRDFPDLLAYQGQALITTDGTTLLGADDKSGVAEIMAALEELTAHPERPHGPLRICFTPDEETGHGADRFDLARFAADLAYTVDGGEIGEFNYQNFNAAHARITIHGKDIHPGSAKGKMVNALEAAVVLDRLLPEAERPQYTDGSEGYYHLSDLRGSVDRAVMKYILRDHDRERFESRKALLTNAVSFINERYGPGTAQMDLSDQYYNMGEKLARDMPVVERAVQAMRAVGVEPKIIPIRGGTDGARLTYMGLPTPNLFTGGHNYHSRYEFIPIPSMEKAVEAILKIVELYAEGSG